MKIPYFYLEAGDLRIFQPGNKYNKKEDIILNSSPRLEILVRGTPEIRGNTLYMNGS